ncbi:MAG: putative 7-carboxy-7-deazaguanine synthase QueE [Oscillospiraceae bacterium]
MAEFKVVEKFVSINGEGQRAGQLAVFIRFKGCNLNCDYCDTKWANEPSAPFEAMDENEIYDYIKSTGVKNVTLTGGEPLLCDNIEILLKRLACDKALNVEIETNGSVLIEPFASIDKRPSFTLDYKLAGSKMEQFMKTENYKHLQKNDTVKFVVSSTSDLERAVEIIREYELDKKCGVYLSAVFGRIEPADIVEFMIKHRLNDINLQLQMHKFIWDPNKRGV